jgi:hypothetical protein
MRILENLGKQANYLTVQILDKFHKVGHKDAKTWMERRLAAMKFGVPNWATTALAGE